MFTLEKIALEVEGVIVGDKSISITDVDDIEHANSGSISFAFLPKYKKSILSSSASAFIVINEEDLQNLPGIVVKNPYLAMIKILDLFSNKISPDYTINTMFAPTKVHLINKKFFRFVFNQGLIRFNKLVITKK